MFLTPALFAIATLTTSVSVAAPSSGPACPAAMVCASDLPSVVRGLQAAGYKGVQKINDRGVPYVASATNGSEFTIDFYTCDDDIRKTGCRTMMIETWYAAKPYLTAALANAYNKTAMYGRAYVADDGSLNLEVALAADGGVPQAQFKAWIDWFTSADGDLDKAVAAAIAASGPPGQPR